MKKRDLPKSSYSLPKEAFSKLPRNLQSLIVLKLIDYSIIEPAGLTILKSLCPNPEQYFTQELLAEKQYNFTTKQHILNILKKHFYAITKANEDNLINVLKYLFSDNRLNVKDFLLDKFISFDKILINLLANKKSNLVEYLLEDKTNNEFTFKDQLILQNENHNNYTLYDIFGDRFPKKIKKHLEDNNPKRSHVIESVEKVIQDHYKEETQSYLEKNNTLFVYENQFNELIFQLFNFNNQHNIKLFLSKLPKVFTKNDLNSSIKVNHFNVVINIFNDGFLYNIDISDRISFFEFCYYLDKNNKDRELSVKISKDIKKLINHKIIDSKDYAFQKQVVQFFVEQTEEGFNNIYKILLNYANKIKNGEIILVNILVDYFNLPIDKLVAYIKLSAHYLNSLNYNHELTNKFTEKAVLLIEECKKDFLIDQEEIVNNIRIAYWNRAVYYNKSNNTTEALKYWVEYLELLNMQDLNNHLDSLKLIINFCVNGKKKTEEEQKYIHKIFNILSTNQENTTGQELFNNIANSNLTSSSIKYFLNKISILPSDDIVLITCKDILENALNAAEAQEGSLRIIFPTSYLDKTYEEGKKCFSLDSQNDSDLVQAVIFYIKHKKFQEAERYLTAAENRYKNKEQIYNDLKNAFSNLHLNLALCFINQDINAHKTIIIKHLNYAKDLNPFLDLETYYLVLDIIQSNTINEQQIQENFEIQTLINAEIDQVDTQNQPTIISELTDKKAKYQKAAKNFLEEQKRKSDNIIANKYEVYSWKIGNNTYSTKDDKIVDLGYGKYCIIDQSLKDLEQYETYQKSMEKGFARAQGQIGVKLAGHTYEIKPWGQDYRLHNNNIIYVNSEGKKLILFKKEGNHHEISTISTNPITTINVDSVKPTPEFPEYDIPQAHQDYYDASCLGNEALVDLNC